MITLVELLTHVLILSEKHTKLKVVRKKIRLRGFRKLELVDQYHQLSSQIALVFLALLRFFMTFEFVLDESLGYCTLLFNVRQLFLPRLKVMLQAGTF